jgi:hypothetical protein
MRSTVRRVESTAVETLPPPSPDADVPAVLPVPPPPVRPHHVPRAGELTTAWRILTGIGWIGIVVVLAATWNVSRQLGLPTWWLGPVDDQRPPYVLLLPFIAPAVMIALVGNRVRYVPWVGVLGAVATAAVGLGDVGRVRGLGVVELIAAGAALLVSIASLSGMYRTADGIVDDAPIAPASEAVQSGDLDFGRPGRRLRRVGRRASPPSG